MTVGRENAGLWLQDVERGPNGEIWYVWVRLRVDGLDAPLRVSSHYETGFDDLAEFFQGLAADWRGWPGERAYESLEHELQLTATHNGHVSDRRPALPVQLAGRVVGLGSARHRSRRRTDEGGG